MGLTELSAAIAALGLEAAFAECIDDAGAAFRGRRIEGPPSSLGFFAPRLTRADARSGRAAGAA